MESFDLISIRNSLVSIAEEIKKDRNDLYQKFLEIFDEIDSLFAENDEFSNNWPMSITDVRKIFDLSVGQIHNNKRKYLSRGEDYFVDRWNTLYLERSGVIEILRHAKTEKGIKWLNKISDSNYSPKEEHLYINIIKYALTGFDNPKKEFAVKVSNRIYKIDLYLQKSKIAIECDERDHYEQEYLDEHIQRQEDIIKELGCKFLRFNPHDHDFNIGELINVIFHYISNNLMNGKEPIDYYMEKRERKIRERKNSKLSEEELAMFE
jgi:very-short-patch-repair endonuclease